MANVESEASLSPLGRTAQADSTGLGAGSDWRGRNDDSDSDLSDDSEEGATGDSYVGLSSPRTLVAPASLKALRAVQSRRLPGAQGAAAGMVARPGGFVSPPIDPTADDLHTVTEAVSLSQGSASSPFESYSTLQQSDSDVFDDQSLAPASDDSDAPPDNRNKYNNIAYLEKQFFFPAIFYLSYISAFIIAAASLPPKPLMDETNFLRAMFPTYYEIALVSIVLQIILFLYLWAKHGQRYLQNFQNVGNLVLGVAVASHLVPRAVFFFAPYTSLFEYSAVSHVIDNKVSTSLTYLTVLLMEFSLFYFDHLELLVNQRWLVFSLILDVMVCNGAISESYLDFQDYNYLTSLFIFALNICAVYWQSYPFLKWVSALWDSQFRARVLATYDRRTIVFISSIAFVNALFVFGVQLSIRVYCIVVAVQDPNGPALKDAIVWSARVGYHLLLSVYAVLGVLQVVNNVPPAVTITVAPPARAP